MGERPLIGSVGGDGKRFRDMLPCKAGTDSLLDRSRESVREKIGADVVPTGGPRNNGIFMLRERP